MKNDYELYTMLQLRMSELLNQPAGPGDAEFNACWLICEKIKNRNGGMPPTK